MEKIEQVRALVRPFITGALTILVCYLAVIGAIKPEQILAIYGPILGFWFGSRGNQK